MAMQNTQNRLFEKLGFNFIELDTELAQRLLKVLK